MLCARNNQKSQQEGMSFEAKWVAVLLKMLGLSFVILLRLRRLCSKLLQGSAAL